MRPWYALGSIILITACVEEPAPLGGSELGLGTQCLELTQGDGVVDDVYVDARRPNRNRDQDGLIAGRVGGACCAETLVRPELPPALTGVRIEAAALRLWQTRSHPLDPRVTAHRITAPWSEATVTYASFAHAYEPAALAAVTVTGREAYTWDVTAAVRSWVEGTAPNHGVALVDLGDDVHFKDEQAQPGRRPAFIVCFTTCADGVQNGDEAGVDCGGALCGACVVDADGDGATSDVDCDDLDAAIHPGAAETCNGRDDDCDGQVDEGACGSPEVCDGVDNDLDGVIDDGNPGGLVDCRHTVSFNPFDPTEIGGWFYGYTACVAGDVACLPVAAIEACDGIDNDHDGVIDDGAVRCRDADDDGSGDPLDQITGCAQVPGYVTDCHDCDDTDPDTGTGSANLDCTGEQDLYADHDCDGTLDRGERNCQ